MYVFSTLINDLQIALAGLCYGNAYNKTIKLPKWFQSEAEKLHFQKQIHQGLFLSPYTAYL